MWRLGVTGGIGAGKSTVCAILQASGAWCIDADAISRASTQASGRALAAIAAHFGPDFVHPDLGLDRARMRELVFTQPSAKAALEAIVHPLVQAEIAEQLRLAQAAQKNWVVLDLPLLVESPHWRPQLDHVLVVDCLPSTQLQRVQTRSGLSESQITAILQHQASRPQRLAAADTVLYNEGLSSTELQNLVRELAQRFAQRAENHCVTHRTANRFR
jgi:dephospho-CoA kinase